MQWAALVKACEGCLLSLKPPKATATHTLTSTAATPIAAQASHTAPALMQEPNPRASIILVNTTLTLTWLLHKPHTPPLHCCRSHSTPPATSGGASQPPII